MWRFRSLQWSVRDENPRDLPLREEMRGIALPKARHYASPCSARERVRVVALLAASLFGAKIIGSSSEALGIGARGLTAMSYLWRY